MKNSNLKQQLADATELRERMWAVIDKRRSELIDRDGNLTDAEQAELAELQEIAHRYLDSIAPPPGI